MEATRDGDFRPDSRWPKKRSLQPSNADITAEAAKPDLALPSSVTPTASSAARRFWWISW